MLWFRTQSPGKVPQRQYYPTSLLWSDVWEKGEKYVEVRVLPFGRTVAPAFVSPERDDVANPSRCKNKFGSSLELRRKSETREIAISSAQAGQTKFGLQTLPKTQK